MQFQVPQFVEVEDKIFGPLTLKQFIYVSGGAGIAFLCYAFLPLPIALLLGLPVLALGLALAFYQFNNRPFVFLLQAAFEYVGRTRRYNWRKEEVVAHGQAPIPAIGSPQPKVSNARSSLTELSQKIEMIANTPPKNPEA